MCLTFKQNSQLQVEARAARTYRDELDALRERAIKADKLESEVGRYKEQLHKMEFYKAKVEVKADFDSFPFLLLLTLPLKVRNCGCS